MHVCYLGPENSLVSDAAVKHFGQEIHLCCEGAIDDVFAKVERGDAHYGVVPARTGSTGLVAKTFDLLMQSNLMIIGEVELKEQLALCGGSAGLSEVEIVYTDAHNLSRTADWLAANLPSAQIILEGNIGLKAKNLETQKNAAVIVSQSLAARLGLNLLAGGIETDLGVDARFIIIGDKVPAATGRDKTSLLCSAKDRAGALRDILQPFCCSWNHTAENRVSPYAKQGLGVCFLHRSRGASS